MSASPRSALLHLPDWVARRVVGFGNSVSYFGFSVCLVCLGVCSVGVEADGPWQNVMCLALSRLAKLAIKSQYNARHPVKPKGLAVVC